MFLRRFQHYNSLLSGLRKLPYRASGKKIFDINHILDAVRVAPNFDRFALSGFVN